MKIILQNVIAKQAWYFGCNITVPFWAKYLAFDKNGILYAYECKPYIRCRPGDGVGCWCNSDHDLRAESIGNVECDWVTWDNSLKEIQ